MIRYQIVASPGLFGTGIRLKTDGPVNHAEFINIGTGQTLGARPNGGIQLRDRTLDHYTLIEQFVCPGIEKAWEWGLTQIGKEYDFEAIFEILIGKRDWRNP